MTPSGSVGGLTGKLPQPEAGTLKFSANAGTFAPPPVPPEPLLELLPQPAATNATMAAATAGTTRLIRTSPPTLPKGSRSVPETRTGNQVRDFGGYPRST